MLFSIIREYTLATCFPLRNERSSMIAISAGAMLFAQVLTLRAMTTLRRVVEEAVGDDAGELVLTSIAAGELLDGVKDGLELSLCWRFLMPIRILPISEDQWTQVTRLPGPWQIDRQASLATTRLDLIVAGILGARAYVSDEPEEHLRLARTRREAAEIGIGLPEVLKYPPQPVFTRTGRGPINPVEKHRMRARRRAKQLHGPITGPALLDLARQYASSMCIHNKMIARIAAIEQTNS